VIGQPKPRRPAAKIGIEEIRRAATYTGPAETGLIAGFNELPLQWSAEAYSVVNIYFYRFTALLFGFRAKLEGRIDLVSLRSLLPTDLKRSSVVKVGKS
jgi:hypothetical protein